MGSPPSAPWAAAPIGLLRILGGGVGGALGGFGGGTGGGPLPDSVDTGLSLVSPIEGITWTQPLREDMSTGMLRDTRVNPATVDRKVVCRCNCLGGRLWDLRSYDPKTRTTALPDVKSAATCCAVGCAHNRAADRWRCMMCPL